MKHGPVLLLQQSWITVPKHFLLHQPSWFAYVTIWQNFSNVNSVKTGTCFSSRMHCLELHQISLG